MADLYINYGTALRDMTVELMERAGIGGRVGPGMRVAVKPNLILARPASEGATTHPEIVEGIIVFLRGHGVEDIVIAEGSWVGDSTKRAWSACGYTELARQYGVALLDTKADRTVKQQAGSLELTVCKSILDADYLINVPVLKGHCQTDMTCCLKNLKGCIPDSEKRRYHTLGLHKPIAALSTVIKPDLHIVDSVCGDLSFEEGGNPIESNRILLGFDPVLLDSYGAQLMGYKPGDIGYLRYAREYGVGLYIGGDAEIVELNADKRPQNRPARSRSAKALAPYIEEDAACSACYAALIFALNKTGTRRLDGKIKIGQGFRGKAWEGMGVGNCTAGCPRHAVGCPPKALDIVRMLEED